MHLHPEDPVTHNVKVIAADFDAISRGEKPFLILKNAELFQKGQIIRLSRFRGPGIDDIDPVAPRLEFEITHVQGGHHGLWPDYVALALTPLEIVKVRAAA